VIGVLVVSHSSDAAKGIRDIASGMAGGDDGAPIDGVGGKDGGLGVSVSEISDALAKMLPIADGIVIIPDLGSSVLSSRGAIELLPPGDAERVAIADAPALEGAMMAAIEASQGASLEAVLQSACDARNLRKGDH
jgi:dihydroxyacetone kinase DhaKLM complex PTS-EIIA-like component DhaM